MAAYKKQIKDSISIRNRIKMLDGVEKVNSQTMKRWTCGRDGRRNLSVRPNICVRVRESECEYVRVSAIEWV